MVQTETIFEDEKIKELVEETKEFLEKTKRIIEK